MKMRDATPEEREMINKYIESISMKTGRTFQEILNNTLLIDNTNDQKSVTNFDILNEFVKKAFGFTLDEDMLLEYLDGMMVTCLVDPKLCFGGSCQECPYKNFWSKEYKEVEK